MSSINEFGGINREKLELFLKEGNMEKTELSQLVEGNRICYINDKGLFRYGGIIIKDETNFFVIRCFNKITFTLQKNTMDEVFIKVDKPIKFKPLGKITNNPLIIDGVILKYFSKKSTLDKFLLTKKYQKLINGAKWEFIN